MTDETTRDVAEAKGRLTDAEIEAGARALFEHFHNGRRYGGDYTWPAPEQHLPWWRDAAQAVLTAHAERVETAYNNGREDHRAHDCCQRTAERERAAAERALREAATDPEVIAAVQWRIVHYGPLDATPFRWSRYESPAHAALSVITDRADALRDQS